MFRFAKITIFIACLLLSAAAIGQTFDLIGPKIDVHIKRGEATLPISSVPNLLAGDRIWVHPDFPESQTTHFVLVIAFLRGATNQPPVEWFTRVETWTRSVRDEGVFVTVPEGAQQALLFLAPETGGDFSTLRNAVRGRPGIFVRASQDLQSASLDRMRLDAYLSQVRDTSQVDPKYLKEHAATAAHSLGIRLDQQCFDKPSDQQAPCLLQHTDNLLMDDAGAASSTTQITEGTKRDLMNQLIYSPMMGGVAFSPYFGALMDTIKILSSMHTAHFQYIPALALSSQDTLNLRLSTAPSFRDPKSVVVIALPTVGPAKALTMKQVDSSDNYCAQKSGLLLAVEAPPVLYTTSRLHDLQLHIASKDKHVDIPITASAELGGFVMNAAAPLLPESEVTAVVKGKYGFDEWEGPSFMLHTSQSGKWTVASGDQTALVIGRDDTLHVIGDSSLCVEKIEKLASDGKPVVLSWKPAPQNSLEVTVPLKDATPGMVQLQIYQYGMEKPDSLELKAYAEAASLDRMALSAGDMLAVLRGTRLDTVAKAELEGILWTPAALSRVDDKDVLLMKTDGSTSKLESGKRYSATVSLLDNRQLKAPVSVAQRRPRVTLLSKGVQHSDSDAPQPVRLGSGEDFPISERLVFFLQSDEPEKFPRDQKIEVAATDDSFHTMLSLGDGSLMLEDTHTVIGTIIPLARFGSSAFGPVRVRAVSSNGVTGDWLPLGTLVRLPQFKDLRCPRTSRQCILTGTNLFLISAVGTTEGMDNAADVPANFTGTQIEVPHPVNGTLFLQLRDNPDTVHTLILPITAKGPAAATRAARGKNSQVAGSILIVAPTENRTEPPQESSPQN